MPDLPTWAPHHPAVAKPYARDAKRKATPKGGVVKPARQRESQRRKDLAGVAVGPIVPVACGPAATHNSHLLPWVWQFVLTFPSVTNTLSPGDFHQLHLGFLTRTKRSDTVRCRSAASFGCGFDRVAIGPRQRRAAKLIHNK